MNEPRDFPLPEPLYAVRSIDVWLSDGDCEPLVFHREEDARAIAGDIEVVEPLVRASRLADAESEALRWSAENARLRTEFMARSTERRVEMEWMAAERDRLLDVFVFPTDQAEDYEEGDPVRWRAMIRVDSDGPEYEDHPTKDEAIAAVRRHYGLDPEGEVQS